MGMGSIWLLGVVLQLTAPHPEDQQVRTGIRYYNQLEYEKVIPTLTRALANKSMSEQDRILALRYLGRAQAVFQRHRRAVRTFMRMLRLDPHFAVSGAESPLIRKALDEARERFKAELESSPPTRPDRAQPRAPPEAEPSPVENSSASDEPAVRQPEDAEPKPPPRADEIKSLPQTEDNSPDWRTAPTPPSTNAVEEKAARSDTRLWWILGTLGGVVVMGAAALLVIRRGDGSPEPGTLGAVRI